MSILKLIKVLFTSKFAAYSLLSYSKGVKSSLLTATINEASILKIFLFSSDLETP